MKIPEVGPGFQAFHKILGEKGPEVFVQVAQSQETQNIFARANEAYWPWEDFKHKARHSQWTPDVLWGFLKYARWGSGKQLNFSDAKGKPFWFWLPDQALKDLHDIDKSVGGRWLLDETEPPPEAKEQYMIRSLMEEAIASSQMEGAATTRRVAKEILRKNLNPKDISQWMITNNYRTLLAIKEDIHQPISIEWLHHVQKMITQNTLDDPATSGRFRNADEPIQVIDQNGQVLHTPPQAKSLSELTQKFCDFANTKQDRFFIHPIVKATILHFWLAYLHPYVDGNGRTARALFYRQMLQQEYWLFEYLPLSRIFLKSRTPYLRAFLHSEQDDGDLTYFIVYHLKAIRRAILELQDYCKEKQHAYRRVLYLLKKDARINYRQNMLIQHALKNPHFIYTIESHKTSHNVTYQTARTDLLTLAQKGYLEKIRSGRAFQFVVPANLSAKLNIVGQRH